MLACYSRSSFEKSTDNSISLSWPKSCAGASKLSNGASEAERGGEAESDHRRRRAHHHDLDFALRAGTVHVDNIIDHNCWWPFTDVFDPIQCRGAPSSATKKPATAAGSSRRLDSGGFQHNFGNMFGDFADLSALSTKIMEFYTILNFQ